MDRSTKFIIAGLAFIVLVGAYGLHTLNKGLEKAAEYRQTFIDRIGDTVIIDKDTAVIVDYSVLEQAFTLSDGRIVNKKIIE